MRKFVPLVIVLLIVALVPSIAQASNSTPADRAETNSSLHFGVLDYYSHPFDEYPVYLEAGEPLTARLDCGPPKPGSLDPYVIVYDPDGIPVAGSDDGIGDGQCGRGYSGGITSFYAAKTGWYTVWASSFDYAVGYDYGTGAGPYNLTLTGEFVGMPGCDQFMPLDKAVGGKFVAPAMAYWAPGEPTDVTFDPGTSVLVLGTDASGAYYQVVFACDLLLVPVESLGPNYDEVWQGMPLPTAVYEGK